MSAYETARTLARLPASSETGNEEKNADTMLNKIAMSICAAVEPEGEGESEAAGSRARTANPRTRGGRLRTISLS